MIIVIPWYVHSDVIHNDLNMKSIKYEITQKYTTYKDRLKFHPNKMATQILDCTLTYDTDLNDLDHLTYLKDMTNNKCNNKYGIIQSNVFLHVKSIIEKNLIVYV